MYTQLPTIIEIQLPVIRSARRIFLRPWLKFCQISWNLGILVRQQDLYNLDYNWENFREFNGTKSF